MIKQQVKDICTNDLKLNINDNNNGTAIIPMECTIEGIIVNQNKAMT